MYLNQTGFWKRQEGATLEKKKKCLIGNLGRQTQNNETRLLCLILHKLQLCQEIENAHPFLVLDTNLEEMLRDTGLGEVFSI